MTVKIQSSLILSRLLPVLIPAMLLPFLACSSGSSKKAAEVILPQAGKVHEHISCKSNTLFTYALYLPSGCSNRFSNSGKQRRYPVIIAFDPHGDGSLPVKLYSSLAEKYGFIILGSNDSRNLQSASESEAVVQAMFDEAGNFLPIDTLAVYVMGFSGGSRVATAAAMYRPYVRGVIGCGAGMPSGLQPPNYKFDYFGIVGLGDFNLSEMVALDKSLGQMNFRHFILEFDGIHGWPGKKEIEKAWAWHSFNLVKDGRIKKTDSTIVLFSASMTADYDSLVKQKRMLFARQNLAFRISCLEGLADVSPLRALLASLEASPDYRLALKQFNDVLEKEQKEQQMLMDALYSKDLKWWKYRLGKYRDNRKPGLTPGDTLMNHRLLAFLGLFCYSNANALLAQVHPEQTRQVITIYNMVEPENPEPYYMMAILSARQNDTVHAIENLKKAYDNGFRSKARAQSQPEFEILKQNTAYFDLLKRMQ